MSEVDCNWAADADAGVTRWMWTCRGDGNEMQMAFSAYLIFFFWLKAGVDITVKV